MKIQTESFRGKKIPSVHLTLFGLKYTYIDEEPIIKPNKDMLDFIKVHAQPGCKFYKNRTSYGIKHDLEIILGRYITNGECIAAFIECGFQILPCGPNAYFNIERKSLDFIYQFRKNIENAKSNRPL